MVGFSRVVLRLAVGVVGFAVGGIVDAACATAGHLLVFLVCVIILIIRSCAVWSLFFISSVIVLVPEAQGSDGVTVAPKSLSLSLSGYVCDVNSCLWRVNLAHAHLMRCSNSTCTAFFEGDGAGHGISRCSSLELLPYYLFLVSMSCWR